MEMKFAPLVGGFIQHFGAIEFFTNNAIRALATDPVLSTRAIKGRFADRVDILRTLLHERTKIDSKKIDSLCNDLRRLNESRNRVVHNPIVTDESGSMASAFILVMRYQARGADVVEKLGMEELRKLVNESSELALRFHELVPQAASTG